MLLSQNQRLDWTARVALAVLAKLVIKVVLCVVIGVLRDCDGLIVLVAHDSCLLGSVVCAIAVPLML
jgi:hypothetical protein